MALQQAIESRTGAVASYWRIQEARVDRSANTLWFTLAGYLDEDARRAGKAPVDLMSSVVSWESGEMPTASAIYAEGKKLPALEGAVDL